jgi:hypothetical protein
MVGEIMKWNKIDQRQVEILFDNGVKMLMIDQKPVAALVMRNNQPIVIRAGHNADDTVEHLLKEWVSHQPVTSAIVAQTVLNRLLDNEGKL